ncbi:MAG: hypothetical protein MUF34_21620, partial [Polyangiaceae bacterium]|nr:hypothetical protein [Polyangiaceae bacterium]
MLAASLWKRLLQSENGGSRGETALKNWLECALSIASLCSRDMPTMESEDTKPATAPIKTATASSSVLLPLPLGPSKSTSSPVLPGAGSGISNTASSKGPMPFNAKRSSRMLAASETARLAAIAFSRGPPFGGGQGVRRRSLHPGQPS